MTEIPTERGKPYLATVIDLYSRWLLGAATGCTPTRSSLATRDQDGCGNPGQQAGDLA